MKKIIGLSISGMIALIVLYLTIQLSGHKESLGLLVLGLLFIDMVAILLGYILKWTRVIEEKVHVVLVRCIILSFIIFFFYHGFYDSTNETRSMLGAFNGE